MDLWRIVDLVVFAGSALLVGRSISRRQCFAAMASFGAALFAWAALYPGLHTPAHQLLYYQLRFIGCLFVAMGSILSFARKESKLESPPKNGFASRD